MAKEQPATPETPEEPKEDPKDKVEMVPKAKYDEQRELIEEYRATLKAFQKDRESSLETSRRSAPVSPSMDDLAQAIASELNVTLDDVKPHLKMFDRAFAVREQQYLGILNALAEKIDGLETRATNPDYADYVEDVDRERQSRVERSLPWISRKEALDIVRGRRLPDILAKEREKAQSEIPTDSPDHGGTTSVTKAGPTPLGRTKNPSPADLAAMTPADRLKLLEELGEI